MVFRHMKLEAAADVARSGAVSGATLATTVGDVDLAVVILLFVAVSTTRASAVVFYDESNTPLTLAWVFKNFIHMLALTVMAYAVILVVAGLGWGMTLGPVLLTGATFGWVGPKINTMIADKWRSLVGTAIRTPKGPNDGQ